VEQTFDNQMILVPLQWMRELTLADSSSVSRMDVMLHEGADELNVQAAIEKILGSKYEVQTRNQQHAILLRAIKIEKLFVFILMAFIMGIASFTLFYALSLLVIEKRKDLRTLLAMGITQRQLLRIFLFVGLFISFSGAIVGMSVGFALGWIQQTFGIIPLGIPNALIDSYPIQMEWIDFLMTALVVIVITFLASIIPAKKAVQITFNQPKAD
jgi:lipoprotein-releasing system permease protein